MNSKMRKRISALVLITVIACTLCACQQPDKGETVAQSEKQKLR